MFIWQWGEQYCDGRQPGLVIELQHPFRSVWWKNFYWNINTLCWLEWLHASYQAMLYFDVSITTISACSVARKARPGLFIVWNLSLVSLPSSSSSKFIGGGVSPVPCTLPKSSLLKGELGQWGQWDHEDCSGRAWPCIHFMPKYLHGNKEAEDNKYVHCECK